MAQTPLKDPRVPLDASGQPLSRTPAGAGDPAATEADMWNRSAEARGMDPVDRSPRLQEERVAPGATAAVADPFTDVPPHDFYDGLWDDDFEDLEGGHDEYAAYGAGFEDDERASSGGSRVSGAGDMLHSAMDAARRNPFGTALLLAGVAMLATPRIERETVRRHAEGVRRDARARLAPHKARLQAQSRSLRDRLSEGTEDMSAAARERVIAARRRALDVSRSTRAKVSEGANDADRMVRENPFVVGGIALATGAALAAVLPGTRFEARNFGALSDRLYDEARTVYQRERERVVAGANAAAEEARSMATEAAREAKSAVPDGKEAVKSGKAHLKDAGDRVTEAARNGAANSDKKGSKPGNA